MQPNRICVLYLLFAAVVSPALAAPFRPQGFIRVCNGKFADAAGKQVLFAGWNGYTNLMSDAYNYLYNGKPDLVSRRFDSARGMGLNLARIWGHGDGDKLVLQTSPGRYNPKIFRALDYVIYQARMHNIKLLVSVTTFWQHSDGILAYADWAGLSYPIKSNTPYYTEQWAAKDAFWINPKARSLYKNHLNNLFSRKNSFSGVMYKNDPTIMGYGLFNEPRCPASQNSPGCVGRIRNWAETMTLYAKSINKNQLMTVGEEGFSASNNKCNPTGVPGNVVAGWGTRTGQDFSTQHRYSDFMEFHLWPVNWYTLELSFISTWLTCHVNACNNLNKPCMLGEFGRELDGSDASPAGIQRTRNPYFNAVYSKTRSLVSSGQRMSGTLFWQWVNDDQSNQGNSVKSHDSTFSQAIIPHAKFMASQSGRYICAARG